MSDPRRDAVLGLNRTGLVTALPLRVLPPTEMRVR